MIDPQEVFKIEPNQIITKYECSVIIDDRDYDIKSFMELSDLFVVPGILDFYFPKFEDFCQIIVNYNIKLMKTANIDENKNEKTINYESGDIVIKQDYVSGDSMDMGLLNKILQGHVKYVKDPKILIFLLHELLPNLDLVHIELIVSNMFRITGKESERCRTTGNYDNSTIFGVKKQPFEDNWKVALAFQNLDKAIQIGLVRGRTSHNPIQNVLEEDFDNI